MKNLKITQEELLFIIDELCDHYSHLMWDKFRMKADHPDLNLDAYLDGITIEQKRLEAIIDKLYEGLF